MKLNNYIAVFLLLLFSFTFLPKETIHLIYEHHHDSEDLAFDCHENHIEQKHEHCDVSKFVFSSVQLTDPSVLFLESEKTFTYQQLNYSYVTGISKYMFGLKAPPAAFSI